MAEPTISIEQAMELVFSEDEFPVDFELAWQWIGYTRKNNAKRALETSGFVEGKEFRVLLRSEQNPQGGRPTEEIWLSVDCFKHLAMMAGTEKGREVRQYFIDCEKRLRELAQKQLNSDRPRDRALEYTFQGKRGIEALSEAMKLIAAIDEMAGKHSISAVAAAAQREMDEACRAFYRMQSIAQGSLEWADQEGLPYEGPHEAERRRLNEAAGREVSKSRYDF